MSEGLQTLRSAFERWNAGRVNLGGRGSGVEFDQPIAWLCKLREGKLVRMHTFQDQADALNVIDRLERAG